jgi:hypothetical protein
MWALLIIFVILLALGAVALSLSIQFFSWLESLVKNNLTVENGIDRQGN